MPKMPNFGERAHACARISFMVNVSGFPVCLYARLISLSICSLLARYIISLIENFDLHIKIPNI